MLRGVSAFAQASRRSTELPRRLVSMPCAPHRYRVTGQGRAAAVLRTFAGKCGRRRICMLRFAPTKDTHAAKVIGIISHRQDGTSTLEPHRSRRGYTQLGIVLQHRIGHFCLHVFSYHIIRTFCPTRFSLNCGMGDGSQCSHRNTGGLSNCRFSCSSNKHCGRAGRWGGMILC